MTGIKKWLKEIVSINNENFALPKMGKHGVFGPKIMVRHT